jgi:zinc protease
VQLACRLPEATPEAAARYALMASVLRARMWHQVREQMGATYGFYTQVSMARGGAAHLLLEGVVDAPQLGAAMTAVRTALTAYAKEGVPEAEVEGARGRLLAEQAVSLTTSRDWVGALLNARVLGWDAEAVTRRPALLQAVTPADLQKEFAGCSERLVVGVVGDEAQARAAVQAAFP